MPLDALVDQLNAVEPNALVAFGLLLLCGVIGGMLANRLAWMPTITAFMLFGFGFGPHGLNLFSAPLVAESQILVDIALGLILYKLGNMLHPLQMLRSRKLLIASLSESGLSFLLVAVTVKLCGYSYVMAAMTGAIAVSSSPAVLVHVSEELQANGPITDRAKSLVAINNLLSFTLFTLTFPFAFSEQEATLANTVLLPLHSLVTSAIIGSLLAWTVVQIAKRIKPHDEHYRFAVIVGGIVLTLGLSKMLGASTLFSTLALGMATRWFEKRHYKLSHMSLSEGGDLFFIALFVVAGAKIDPEGLIQTGIVPLLLALARAGGKFLGIRAAQKTLNIDPPQGAALSLLLLPMAGMAIGLAATLQNIAPALGEQIATLVFAMIAIFETLGPFAAVKAFRLSGEANQAEKTPPPIVNAP